MRALVEVELRRLLARRLLRTLAAVLLLALAAAPPLVDWAFSQRARIERDADLERCVRAEPPKVRNGAPVPAIPGDVAGPGQREGLCDDAIPHRDDSFRLDEVGDVLRPVGALLVVAAFAVGASAVGADWQAVSSRRC